MRIRLGVFVAVQCLSTVARATKVLRLIDSIQLTAAHKVATPVNWKHGQEVIILASVSDAEAKEAYPAGWRTVKPYLRVIANRGRICRAESRAACS
jgi:thioredoxin-dependent peroxiredoxin